MYDVCIIGAGVVGCAIAHELAATRLKVVVLDGAEDVSQGASKANSGIVHGGYASPPGTLKAELSVIGNRLYDELDAKLHFGFRRIGALVLAFSEEEMATIENLRAAGRENGVDDLKILGKEALANCEPNLGPGAIGALESRSVGVTSPYELTIALAENAVANGAELRLRCRVIGIEPGDDFRLATEGGEVRARCVVNAAGVRADSIAELVGARNFTISPRKGEYLLLRRGTGSLVRHVLFQVPTSRGKGVLVTPTFHGNLLIGPSAEDVVSRENVDTDTDSLLKIVEVARRSAPGFDLAKVITTFAGVRATSDRRDFIVEESVVPRFFNVAGIESPGLTAAPAIARRVAELLSRTGLDTGRRTDYRSDRAAIIVPTSLSDEEADRLTRLDPSPERIICRCERVTEGEILDALGRGIPVDTIDAVKRRTRAGMGMCQGTFCRPRVMALLARELGLPEDRIRIRDGDGPHRSPARTLARAKSAAGEP